MWSGLDHLCDMEKRGQWLSSPLSFGFFLTVYDNWILDSLLCLSGVNNSYGVSF